MLALKSRPCRVHSAATPGGAAPSAAGLDREALARLVELDPTGKGRLVERVLQAFLASVARLRPLFEAALASRDAAGVRLVAHTLKSSSASIGALELSRCCAQAEAAARLGDEHAFGAEAAAMAGAIDRALQAVEQQLKAAP